jgi:SpoIVB peptidase S55
MNDSHSIPDLRPWLSAALAPPLALPLALALVAALAWPCGSLASPELGDEPAATAAAPAPARQAGPAPLEDKAPPSPPSPAPAPIVPGDHGGGRGPGPGAPGPGGGRPGDPGAGPGGGPSAPALADPLPTIDLDEVKTGQRGYGLTVFAGGQPERFEVEVIGVMRNISPDMSYILARLSGRGLESSGVAAGMSGSPVFLDGRLAGAVSFGWPFSKEAISGITPIASMRRLATLGGGPQPAVPLPPVELKALLAGRVPGDLLARQLARLRPNLGGAPEGALAGVEWSTSGFGEQSRGVLRQALGSVAPAGRAPAVPGAPAPQLVPGSAVAAVLVDGDFQLAATGTVTDHLGDRILAFGHPFLGLGPVRLPMAAAEVVTVLSSQNTSFKIANLGQTVGAFEQDRQAGIEGRVGAVAPMIPMVLRIGNPAAAKQPRPPGAAQAGVAEEASAPRQFRVRLADVPELLPLLAGSTLLAGLESASYSGGPQSIEMTARFRLEGYGDLEMRQSFDGENAGAAMAAHLLAVAGYLVQSPLERVRISGLEVEVEQSPQPRAATLLAAHADRTVVRPGEHLGVNLELLAYRGERFRHSFDLELPRDLPLGRYSLLIGDGGSADAARLTLAPVEPTSFPQALALLRSLHSHRDLTLLGFYGGAGLSVAGELMPRLPGSVRSLWGASDSSGAVPLRSAIVQERHENLGVPLDGLLRIDLEVRRPEEPASPNGRSAPDGTELAPDHEGMAPAASAEGAGR